MTYYIKATDSLGNKVVAPIIVSDSVFNKESVSSVQRSTLEECLKDVDDFLETMDWQLLSLPYRNENAMSDMNKLILPNLYFTDKIDTTSMTAATGELSDGAIIENFYENVDLKLEGGNTLELGVGAKWSTSTFPAVGYTIYNDDTSERVEIRTLVLQTSGVVDGKVLPPPTLQMILFICKISRNKTTGTYYFSASRYYRSPDNSKLPAGYADYVLQKVPGPGEGGGSSEPGGGTGDFDGESDPIEIPGLPELSAVSAGMVSLYTPTLAQLNELSRFLWSPTFIESIAKLFSDPMGAILGLSIVPVDVPQTSLEEISVGYVSTGVSMYRAGSQYVSVDCGEINVNEYWGSYLDYSPYTKLSIYLPYIGTKSISTDDCMGKAIRVVYNVDILSGACTAIIKCGDHVLYQFSGSCSSSIPITGRDFTQTITSVLQLAASGATTIASPAAAVTALASATANSVAGMKPAIQKTGAVSGSAGMLGVQYPYIIKEMPRQSLADGYKTFVGYPSNISSLLGSLSGFTTVESIHLEGTGATEKEVAEIETLLKSGVIL